jgi:HK97 family phage major capsid protein
MSKVFNDEQRAEFKAVFEELIEDNMPVLEAQKTAAIEAAKKADDDDAPDPSEIALQEQMKAYSDKLDALVEHLEGSPAIKSAGYVSDDGGDADKNVKSFGDFLLAIKRGDTKRLTSVYKSRRQDWTKDIQSQDGPAGGYLVPEEYHARLMEVPGAGAVIRPRATVIPVATDTGRLPSLDQSTAPTAGAGNTAFAGGVVATWTAAGGTLTETQPTFNQVEYVVRKLAGYTEVENEVLADSAFGIETLLLRLFGRAVASMEDHAFIRGDGVAEPLGILNASCAIAVTTATNNAFAYADALAMRARFQGQGGQPVWIIHPGVWPDIGIFEVGTGGAVWMANVADTDLISMPLLGYPILESEHMPQDDYDDVILADLSAYVIFDRAQMSIAYSEHAAFTTDKGTWRFIKRLDGQPWLRSTITLADPQGSYTVSPFVYHDD